MRRRQPSEPEDVVESAAARGRRLSQAWLRWKAGERSPRLVAETVEVIVECLDHHEKPHLYYWCRVAGSPAANDYPGGWVDPAAAEVVRRVNADESWLSRFRSL